MNSRFQPTSWSLVIAASGEATELSRGALMRLCELYWYPVYAFIRRRGSSAEEARDLTRGYFTRLLEQRGLHHLPGEAGRFRSFLLASVSRFLADEANRENPARRTGKRSPIRLDTESADLRYRTEPAEDSTPEGVFEKQWALALLDRAMARLQEEHTTPEAAARFRRLSPYLSGEDLGPADHPVGEELGMSDTSVRRSLQRLRKRFGELLREEIRETVADAATVDVELRHLLTSLSQ